MTKRVKFTVQFSFSGLESETIDLSQNNFCFSDFYPFTGHVLVKFSVRPASPVIPDIFTGHSPPTYSMYKNQLWHFVNVILAQSNQ